jgi:hypothetical protein
MEEAVSAIPDPVTLALGAAMTGGDELAPQALLAAINEGPNPTLTLGDMYRGHAPFEALRREFGFLHLCQQTRKAPSPPDQNRLAALMRWLIREFKAWSAANDPECRRLAALFAITSYCDHEDGFWPGLAPHLEIKPPLVEVLERRIAGLRAQPSASAASRSPISDGEIIGRFNAADDVGDWATIAFEWLRFGDLIFPDYFSAQSVQYLHKLAPDALSRAVDQLHQMVPVMQVLLALSVRKSIGLAIASGSPHVQFGAILRTLQRLRPQRGEIAPDENALLAQLLTQIASNDEQWRAWMRALNRFPIRYPPLQTALGTALAQGPESALAPYVDAVNLTTMGVGRAQVAECLRAFRKTAPLSHRQALWRRAHERWTEWNFGLNDTLENLVKICSCELDYAVVGYAVESMDAQAKSQRCSELVTTLSALPRSWHASVTDFRRSVNRLLSCFQPYLYAQQMGAADDWLIEGKQFLPFDPRQDRYNALLYGISPPPAK